MTLAPGMQVNYVSTMSITLDALIREVFGLSAILIIGGDPNVIAFSWWSPNGEVGSFYLTGGFEPLPPPLGSLAKTSVPIAGALIGAIVVPVALALTDVPDHIFPPWFEKVNPADENVYVESIDSITMNGFNCNLSSPAIAGQILHVSYIP